MEGTAKLNALLLLIRGDNLGHPRSGVRFACINGRSVLALHIGQGLRADIGTSRAEPGDHIADIFIGPAAPAIGTAYAVLCTKGKAAFVKVNDFFHFFYLRPARASHHYHHKFSISLYTEQFI
jgi:hypothetical protein